MTFLRWLRSLFVAERPYAPPRPPDRIRPRDRALPFLF